MRGRRKERRTTLITQNPPLPRKSGTNRKSLEKQAVDIIFVTVDTGAKSAHLDFTLGREVCIEVPCGFRRAKNKRKDRFQLSSDAVAGVKSENLARLLTVVAALPSPGGVLWNDEGESEGVGKKRKRSGVKKGGRSEGRKRKRERKKEKRKRKGEEERTGWRLF